jgi:hypothetical protein
MSITLEKIKVISQADRERLSIDAEIRRHEVALIRALKTLNRRFPTDGVRITEDLSQRILLTRDTV